MAIAFDAFVSGGGGNPWAHPCTGSDRVIVVVSRQALSGVTYGGVALTKLASFTQSGGMPTPVELWYLLGPPAGTNNVNLSPSSSGVSVSYSGVGGLDGFVTQDSAAGATSLTTSITTTVNNAWLVVAEGSYGGGTAPTAGAGLTRRGSYTAGFNNPAFFDSNSAKTPAGLHSGTTNQSNAGFAIHHLMVALAPAAAAVTDGRVSQLVAELLTHAAPPEPRVSQLVAETLTSLVVTPARVSQLVAETLTYAPPPPPPVRVSQSPVELITQYPTAAFVSQAPLELLQQHAAPLTGARVSQTALEIIYPFGCYIYEPPPCINGEFPIDAGSVSMCPMPLPIEPD